MSHPNNPRKMRLPPSHKEGDKVIRVNHKRETYRENKPSITLNRDDATISGWNSNDDNLSYINDRPMKSDDRHSWIGSPVPCTNQDSQLEIGGWPETNPEHERSKVDSTLLDTRRTLKSEKRSLSLLTEQGKVRNRSRVSSFGKERKSSFPSITVQRCEDQGGQADTDTSQEASPVDSPVGSLSGPETLRGLSPSSPQHSLLLSPSPPLCRKRFSEHRTVAYYNAPISSSRSEGCIQEAVSNDNLRSETTEFIPFKDVHVYSHKRGTSRSLTSSPLHISVSNTKALLSPSNSPKESFIGGHLVGSSGVKSGSCTTRIHSPGVSPISSPINRRKPPHKLQPLSLSPKSQDTGHDTHFPSLK